MEIGLYFYKARFYDPSISRFVQADTIVPGPVSPQSWDRYAYGYNNPSRYSDPSGHKVCEGFNECNSGREIKYEPFIEFEFISDLLQAKKWKWEELTPTYQHILEKAGWNQTKFNQSEYAGLGIREIGGEIPEDPLADIILILTFGKIGYSVLTPLPEYFCLNDGDCGNELEILKHALERLEERGVSIDQLNTTLQNPPFSYFHDEVWKVGYFDPVTKILVSVYDGVILTVMNNVKLQYIINLLSKGKQ